jgi:hypothetical protein
MLHGNHSDMIKFSSPTENDYKKISNVIAEIIEDRITQEYGEQNGTPMALVIANPPDVPD